MDLAQILAWVPLLLILIAWVVFARALHKRDGAHVKEVVAINRELADLQRQTVSELLKIRKILEGQSS